MATVGRIYCDNKRTVEESTELSIFRLNRWGLLDGLQSTMLTWTWRLSGHKSSIWLLIYALGKEPYVRLRYTITRRRDGSTQDYDYNVSLATTPCHLGGRRYWFLCPQCGRRAGKLYRRPMGEMYFCRICNDLTYESRNESRLGRFGAPGYVLVTDRKIGELYDHIKRWTWRGKPTRKVRKLRALEAKTRACLDSPRVKAFVRL